MTTITITNTKGGVGKTTLAVNISATLAHRGYRVLLIDADPQANATVSVQCPESAGIYDLLVREANWQSVIVPVPPRVYLPEEVKGSGLLHLLPSNIEARSIPTMLTDMFALRTRLDQVQELYDFIIIDTPPTPTLFHNSILLATDVALLPTKLERLSIQQLVKTLGYLNQVNTLRQQANLGQIDIFGIVPMMARPGTLEHRENLQALNNQYRSLVLPAVAMRTVWAEASHAGLPVFVFDPKSEATGEINTLVDLIEGEYC